MDKNYANLRHMELSLASQTGNFLLFPKVQFYLKNQLEGFLDEEWKNLS